MTHSRNAAEIPPITCFQRHALTSHAEAIRRHPAFPQAMQRYAGTALDTFDDHWRESKLVCQTARYVTLFFILHLEATADPDDPASGATLAGLQKSVASGPFASASWVKLAVRTFAQTGLIEYLPPGPDYAHPCQVNTAWKGVTPRVWTSGSAAFRPRAARPEH